MTPLTPYQPPDKEKEQDRIVAAGLGGALLGGALFALPGVVLGTIIGLVLGQMKNDEEREKHPPQESGPR